MSINLDDYHEQLDQLDPHVRDTLEASFARGGARDVARRGCTTGWRAPRACRSSGAAVTWSLPTSSRCRAVAKEVGEEVVKDAIVAAMKLAVDGERRGDPADVRHPADRRQPARRCRAAARLPRARSTSCRPRRRAACARCWRTSTSCSASSRSGGLRRWALWGAQAHLRDFDAQIGVFRPQERRLARRCCRRSGAARCSSTTSASSISTCARFWGRDFFMRPTSGDYETREGYKPYIETRVIHLPDAFDDFAGHAGQGSVPRRRRACRRAPGVHHEAAVDGAAQPGADVRHRPVRGRARRSTWRCANSPA
ncbi:MAG: hypothetical protein MZV65_30890 [Chromatiales bacterium]|nr:hypothetical protein [Chromatiales bacterium]